MNFAEWIAVNRSYRAEATRDVMTRAVSYVSAESIEKYMPHPIVDGTMICQYQVGSPYSEAEIVHHTPFYVNGDDLIVCRVNVWLYPKIQRNGAIERYCFFRKNKENRWEKAEEDAEIRGRIDAIMALDLIENLSKLPILR